VTDPDDKAHALQTERRLAEQTYATAERLRHVANDAIATVGRLKAERDALQAENTRLRAVVDIVREEQAIRESTTDALEMIRKLQDIERRMGVALAGLEGS